MARARGIANTGGMASCRGVPTAPRAGLVTSKRGAAAALTIVLAACGDPLFDDQYRGTPLFHIDGKVDSAEGATSDVTDLRLALFFNPRTLDSTRPDEWVELSASATTITQIPSPYTMNIFALPSEALLIHNPDGTAAGYGVARILAYRDRSHNGRRDPDEPVAAIENPGAHLYVPTPLAAGAGPVSTAFAAGLHSLMLPQRCGKVAVPPLPPSDCLPRLFSRCASNSECGPNGTCLKETNLPWPAGSCVVADVDGNRCRPAGSGYLPAPLFAPVAMGVRGYFVKACTSDLDCRRDKEPALYTCETGLRLCMPAVPQRIAVGLEVAINMDVEPFCAVPRP